MIDLCQWRTSIGAWNSRHFYYSKIKIQEVHGVNRRSRNGSLNKNSPNLKLLGFILCLYVLILSGDVELNPGPQIFFTGMKKTLDFDY